MKNPRNLNLSKSSIRTPLIVAGKGLGLLLYSVVRK